MLTVMFEPLRELLRCARSERTTEPRWRFVGEDDRQGEQRCDRQEPSSDLVGEDHHDESNDGDGDPPEPDWKAYAIGWKNVREPPRNSS